MWEALGLSAEQEPIARMSPEPARERIDRAVGVASIPRPGQSSPSASSRISTRPDGSAHIVVEAAERSPAALIAAATLAERIRTALGAESLSAPLPEILVEVSVPDSQEDLS